MLFEFLFSFLLLGAASILIFMIHSGHFIPYFSFFLTNRSRGPDRAETTSCRLRCTSLLVWTLSMCLQPALVLLCPSPFLCNLTPLLRCVCDLFAFFFGQMEPTRLADFQCELSKEQASTITTWKMNSEEENRRVDSTMRTAGLTPHQVRVQRRVRAAEKANGACDLTNSS